MMITYKATNEKDNTSGQLASVGEQSHSHQNNYQKLPELEELSSSCKKPNSTNEKNVGNNDGFVSKTPNKKTIEDCLKFNQRKSGFAKICDDFVDGLIFEAKDVIWYAWFINVGLFCIIYGFSAYDKIDSLMQNLTNMITFNTDVHGNWFLLAQSIFILFILVSTNDILPYALAEENERVYDAFEDAPKANKEPAESSVTKTIKIMPGIIMLLMLIAIMCYNLVQFFNKAPSQPLKL
jgi:hypothetical protein